MKKSKLGILVSMSLISNVLVPVCSFAEPTSEGLIENQIEIESPLFSEEAEIPIDEEDASRDEEQTYSKLDSPNETNDLETSQIDSDGDTDELPQSVELYTTIVDKGLTSFGEWILYSDGLLTISGNIDGRTIPPWQEHIELIKSIEFLYSNNRDLSGDFTTYFNNYVNLESVDFGTYDVSRVTSFAMTFRGLQNLMKVSFKDVGLRSESKLTSTNYMFTGCSSLQELDLSGFDTSSVTDMGGMFNGCSSLQELDFSEFDTSSVTSMRNMFSGCSSLQELDLSGFDTSSVTDMMEMFSRCRSLQELDLSEFDTSSVTDMKYMFSGCSSLQELNLSEFDTSSVTSMRNMFTGCSSLQKLDLSGFDTSSVTDMKYIFSGCSSLQKLDLSGFDTSSVTDMMYMFNGCSSLKELDLSGFDTSSVTSMRSMFIGCNSLQELDLSGFDTSSVTSMRDMFSECRSLQELDLSRFDTSSVTDRMYMFLNCIELSILQLSKNFKFAGDERFPALSNKNAWQADNKELFFSSENMISYHNEMNEMNTYRKVAYVEMTMNAMGGVFEGGSNTVIQKKAITDTWEELVPQKENYQFDGWYVDQEYTEKFDFSQPVNEAVTIFARWIENYIVTIPATVNLESQDKVTVSGTNSGAGTLKVNLNETESQISNSSQLKLTHRKDFTITAHSKLSWEQTPEDIWNVLTIASESGSVSKSADIKMSKPEEIQAGDYEGQMVFSIRYE